MVLQSILKNKLGLKKYGKTENAKIDTFFVQRSPDQHFSSSPFTFTEENMMAVLSLQSTIRRTTAFYKLNKHFLRQYSSTHHQRIIFRQLDPHLLVLAGLFVWKSNFSFPKQTNGNPSSMYGRKTSSKILKCLSKSISNWNSLPRSKAISKCEMHGENHHLFPQFRLKHSIPCRSHIV